MSEYKKLKNETPYLTWAEEEVAATHDIETWVDVHNGITRDELVVAVTDLVVGALHRGMLLAFDITGTDPIGEIDAHSQGVSEGINLILDKFINGEL